MKGIERKEKQKIRIIRLKGSSTIEAALIMPLILTVLFLVIYLTLFLYGKVQLTRTAYVSVLRASQAELETTQKRAAIAQKEFETLLNESYLTRIDVSNDVRISGDTVTIQVEYLMNADSAVFMEKGLNQRTFGGSMGFKAKMHHPASFIWNCRRIKEGISEQSNDDKKEQLNIGQKQEVNYGDGIQTGSQ